MPEPAVAPVDINDLTITAKNPPVPDPSPDLEPASNVEVVVNGVKYIVTPEMAKDMKSAEEKASRDKTLLEQQILSKPPEAAPAAEPTTQPDNLQAKADIGDRIFSEPDKVLQELEDRVESKLRTEYQKNEATKAQTQNYQVMLDEFYKGFFSDNKELGDDRGLVELIFEKNYANWIALYPRQPDKWKELLAEQSQEVILRNVKRNQNQGTNPALVLESGGQAPMGVPQAASKDEKPVTLTSIIKDISRAKRDNRSVLKK